METVDCYNFSLSSQDAVTNNGSLNSDVQFFLSWLKPPSFPVDYATIRIVSATIPNFFPNLSSATLTFSITDLNQNPTFFSISIPDGLYDISNCIQAINDAIQCYQYILDGGYAFSALLKFEYSSTRNRVFIAVGPRFSDRNAIFTFYPSDFSYQLGFDLPETGYICYFGQVAYAPRGPNLTGVSSLYFICDQISPHGYSTEMNSPYFAHIPILGNRNSTYIYQPHDLTPFRVPLTSLNCFLRFHIFDQLKQYADFQGYDWNIVFELCFYYPPAVLTMDSGQSGDPNQDNSDQPTDQGDPNAAAPSSMSDPTQNNPPLPDEEQQPVENNPQPPQNALDLIPPDLADALRSLYLPTNVNPTRDINSMALGYTPEDDEGN